jgi:hypothetical protein
MYASNSVTSANVHVTDTIDVLGSMTANAANATFFFDTFTIPYVNTQYMNVASSITAPLANIATMNVGYLTVNSAVVYGTSTLNVYGTSNLSTVFAKELNVTGTMNAASVVASTHYGAIAGANAIAASTLTLTTALPVTSGGTGTTTSTGTGSVVLSAGPTLSGTVTGGTFSGTHTGDGSGITSLNMGNAGSGTLAVARGGTGVTSSTGTGSVVLSAGPTLSGTVTGGTFSGTHTGDGSGITSLNMGNAGSGTLAVARGGTGVTSSTGTGSVVLSASPALSGTATFASITTSGSVGIGTASPGCTLDINTSGNIALRLQSGSGFANNPVGMVISTFNDGSKDCGIRNANSTLELTAPGNYGFFRGSSGSYTTFICGFLGVLTGGATTISVDASGYLQRGAVSDQRLKSNIMTMTDFGLKTITDLRPVTYEATPESLKRIGAGVHIGLVAQEVQTIFPYAVSADQDEQKTLTIDYIKIVPVMINAIKELSSKNTALNTQLAALESRLAALEARA